VSRALYCPGRLPNTAIVYQCPECDNRYLGQQRWEDCQSLTLAVPAGRSGSSATIRPYCHPQRGERGTAADRPRSLPARTTGDRDAADPPAPVDSPPTAGSGPTPCLSIQVHELAFGWGD